MSAHREPSRISRQAKVVQEFGRWLDPCHQKMVAGAGTGDMEQVSLAFVDAILFGPNRVDLMRAV